MESFLRDTKVQKKKFKRAKRRAIGPWKILTIISAVRISVTGSVLYDV